MTKQREILAEKTFSVDRHAVAVTVAPTAPPKEIAPIFGASVHFWAEEQEIPLAALIGFHSLRLHVISWDQIEPRKGVFNWSKVDACLERTRAAGFPDGQLVFNVIDTPKWAAARPDMEFNQNPGASPLYRGHAPQNIEDWCSFLTSLAKRYPEVKRYELWNEPNFPGYSSFFYEEPKRFVPLVTEGAAALRKVLPGVTIWLSGNEGARYREFYRELLKLGIGNSFDVLALHFRDADPEPYMLLNRRLGIPPRPWVNSEWHGCLTLPMNRNTPSEKGFARRMVLDFLLQAARGAREVDLFSILNLAGCERETLAFLREHKYNFTHLAGLFRRRPYPQPRYVASAWQLFTSSVAGELRVGKGYGFGDWKVQSYSSDAGDCLVAWHEGAKAARVDTRILAALHAETDIRRPDGSPFDPAAEVLDPESYLLIRRPLSSVVAGWRNEEQLLRGENALAIPLEHRFSGHYRRGSLFDETMREIDPDTFAWQTVTKRTIYDQNAAAAQIRARFAVGMTEKFFDLAAVVEDSVHVGHGEDMQVWGDDSIQFAFDTRGNGRNNDRVEFAAALENNGRSSLWKVVAPDQKGEMISGFTSPGERVRNAVCRISRSGNRTIYRIRIAFSELFPLTSEVGKGLRFAFLVNNNDGEGRAFYQIWGDGIGDVKDPALYGDLYVKTAKKRLLEQNNLRTTGWARDYSLQITGKGSPKESVRIEIAGQRVAGVFSDSFPVEPGVRYRVTFRARGTTRITFAIDPARARRGGMKRRDLLRVHPLTPEYREYEFEFSAGKEDRECGFSAFGWEQPNSWFEITDFRVVAK